MANVNPGVMEQIYQHFLGRSPTEFEYNGFLDAMKREVLDPIGLTLFLQSSAEYQSRQLPGQLEEFDRLQEGADRSYTDRLLKRGFDEAERSFRQRGRSDSSGLVNAYARTAEDIYGRLAERRSNDRTNLFANAYSSMMDANASGRNIYNRAIDRQFENEDFYRSAALEERVYDKAVKQARENQWWKLAGTGIELGSKAYNMYQTRRDSNG